MSSPWISFSFTGFWNCHPLHAVKALCLKRTYPHFPYLLRSLVQCSATGWLLLACILGDLPCPDLYEFLSLFPTAHAQPHSQRTSRVTGLERWGVWPGSPTPQR